MSRRGKQRAKIKRPNGLLYFVGFIFGWTALKLLFRTKFDKSNYDPPKGPCVILCNHCSFMDFVLANVALYPRRVHNVAAQKFFFFRPMSWLLPMMGAVPKNLFDADARAIMAIMAVIREGGRLLLYPEGRCSVGGGYAGIHKSTGKLIKKLGVPVLSCHLEGSYLCMPFWRDGFRPGRTRVTLSNFLSADEVRELGADEINTRIDRRLSGYDTAPPKKPFVVFKRKRLTSGFEKTFFWCPGCGGDFTLGSRDNSVICSACGLEAELDVFGAFHTRRGEAVPGTTVEWYRAQAEYCTSLLREDMEPIKTRVAVKMPLGIGLGMDVRGHGELALDDKGWRYTGSIGGESADLFFPLSSVPAVPYDPDDNFQIYSGGSFYSFIPENPLACSKFALLGECAYRRFVSPQQMTPGEEIE